MPISKINIIQQENEILNAYTNAALANLGQRFSSQPDNILPGKVELEKLFNITDLTYTKPLNTNTNDESTSRYEYLYISEDGTEQLIPVKNISEVNSKHPQRILFKKHQTSDSIVHQVFNTDILQIDLSINVVNDNIQIIPQSGVNGNTNIFNTSNTSEYEIKIFNAIFEKIVSSLYDIEVIKTYCNNKKANIEISIFIPVTLILNYIYNSSKILYGTSNINIKYWKPQNNEVVNKPNINSTDNFILVCIPIISDRRRGSINDNFVSNIDVLPGNSVLKSYFFVLDNPDNDIENNSKYSINENYTAPYINENVNWVINGVNTDIKISENYTGGLFTVYVDMLSENGVSITLNGASDDNSNVLYNENFWKNINGDFNIKNIKITNTDVKSQESISISTVYPTFNLSSPTVNKLSISQKEQIKSTLILNITRCIINDKETLITTFWKYSNVVDNIINEFNELEDYDYWTFEPVSINNETSLNLYDLIDVQSVVKTYIDELTKSLSSSKTLSDFVIFNTNNGEETFKNTNSNINLLYYPSLLPFGTNSDTFEGFILGSVTNKNLSDNNTNYKYFGIGINILNNQNLNRGLDDKIIESVNVNNFETFFIKDSTPISFIDVNRIIKGDSKTLDRIIGVYTGSSSTFAPYLDLQNVILKDTNVLNRYNIISAADDGTLYHAYIGTHPSADKYSDKVLHFGTTSYNANIGLNITSSTNIDIFKEYTTLSLDFSEIKFGSLNTNLVELLSTISYNTVKEQKQKDNISDETIFTYKISGLTVEIDDYKKNEIYLKYDEDNNIVTSSKIVRNNTDINCADIYAIILNKQGNEILNGSRSSVTFRSMINGSIISNEKPLSVNLNTRKVVVDIYKLLQQSSIKEKIFTDYTNVLYNFKNNERKKVNIYTVDYDIYDGIVYNPLTSVQMIERYKILADASFNDVNSSLDFLNKDIINECYLDNNEFYNTNSVIRLDEITDYSTKYFIHETGFYKVNFSNNTSVLEYESGINVIKDNVNYPGQHCYIKLNYNLNSELVIQRPVLFLDMSECTFNTLDDKIYITLPDIDVLYSFRFISMTSLNADTIPVLPELNISLNRSK